MIQDLRLAITKFVSKEELLKFTALAENYSMHPIAESIKKAYNTEINNDLIEDYQELSGRGISAKVDGKKVLVGNNKLLEENNIKYKPSSEVGTVLYIVIDGKYAGCIVISDKIKQDSEKIIQNLKKSNVNQIVMLTGDRKSAAEDVAQKLKIDKVYSELLPVDKVEKVEELIEQKSSKGKLAFVGDGINDAPVLAISDIGIAMGALGSDAAIEAADIVLMNDDLSRIEDGIKLSKKTMKIVKQNIVFAIFIKIAVLVLSALGLTTMWWAVFADVGVSIIAILNSFRVSLRYPGKLAMK